MIRFNALQQTWAEQGPPVHRSVAAYLGFVGVKRRGADRGGDEDDFERDMRALAPSGAG